MQFLVGLRENGRVPSGDMQEAMEPMSGDDVRMGTGGLAVILVKTAEVAEARRGGDTGWGQRKQHSGS